MAMSLPDDTYEAVYRRAKELGVSRSEFFTAAARRYLEDQDRSRLTEQINDALAHVTQDDSSEGAVAARRSVLAAGPDRPGPRR